MNQVEACRPICREAGGGRGPDTRDRAAEAFSRIASSIFVVATAVDGRRHGRTATSVTPVSVEPPRVLVSVARMGGMVEDIEASGGFSLALLHERQAEISDIFAGRAGIVGDARFAGAGWTAWPSGRPLLSDAALNLDCILDGHADITGHRLFIGRLVASRIGRGRPLLYARRRYREMRA